MYELPFPRSRIGWVGAALLIFFSFIAYYLEGFDSLYAYYEENLYEIIPSKEIDSLQLTVKIKTPTQFYRANPRWMYISIINDSDVEIDDFELWFDIQPLNSKDTSTPTVQQYFLEQENDFYSPSIVFEKIYPHTVAEGKVKIVISTNSIIKNIWFRGLKNGQLLPNEEPKSLELFSSIPTLKIDSRLDKYKAFILTMIESVLLPPWSNGVIPLIILMWCFLVEKKICKRGDDKEWEDSTVLWEKRGWLMVFQVILSGVGSALFLIGVFVAITQPIKSFEQIIYIMIWVVLIIFLFNILYSLILKILREKNLQQNVYKWIKMGVLLLSAILIPLCLDKKIEVDFLCITKFIFLGLLIARFSVSDEARCLCK